MHPLADLHGRTADLGRCLGRGGEGAVFALPDWPGSAAKIYARRPDEAVARKLRAMVELGTDELASLAAWPQGLLVDRGTGDAVGFLMPRVDDHREIHALYGPTARKAAFPDASWAFLVRVARKVAAAFDVVHRHGHVIGDVNQGNVVVSRKATVRLIDCDSFQVTHRGETYPCKVGVPLFTPPELQGQRLDAVTRTADHDRFGLAVLVFQLLFMGRHPFAGRHPGRVLTAEAAIGEGLFAFGKEARVAGVEPPPFSLLLEDVPPTLAALFERAFSREAAEGGRRPSASDWVFELDSLEARLVICGEDPRHVHAPGPCPWCRMENEGGPSFFYLTEGSAPDAFDLGVTWRAIEAVLSPGEAPFPSPSPPAAPGPPETAAVRVRRAVRKVLSPRRARRERREAEERSEAISRAEAEVARLEARWRELCGEKAFSARRKVLAEAKVTLERLVATEEDERRQLVEYFRERFRPPDPNKVPLEAGLVPGLDPAAAARLAAHGLATVADVSAERLFAVRPIDPFVVRGLLKLKADFCRRGFDPQRDVPVAIRWTLVRRQEARRADVVATLRSGPLFLAEARRQALVFRDTLAPELEQARRRLAGLRSPEGSRTSVRAGTRGT